MTLARTSATTASTVKVRRGTSRPSRSPSDIALLDLQRTAGNRAVVRHLAAMQTRSERLPILVPIQRCGPTPCSCSDDERDAYAARQGEERAEPATGDSLTVQRSAT